MKARQILYINTVSCQNLPTLASAHFFWQNSMLTKSTMATTGLTLALIASNVTWATYALYQDEAMRHWQQSADDTATLLNQALSVLPVAADEDASQHEVIAAAQRSGATTAPYEKGGYIWVESLGMKFNDHGRLVSVATSDQDQEIEPQNAEDIRMDGGTVASHTGMGRGSI